MRFVSSQFCFFVLILIYCTLGYAAPPPLPLAISFDANKHQLADYYISEKLDGVRAFWDGEKLISRGGNRFAAPDWFTRGLPPQPLDGELWAGRNTFELSASIVKRLDDSAAWRQLRFYVFELPTGAAQFSERYQQLLLLAQQYPSPYWLVVAQHEAPVTPALLDAQLRQLVAAGGEGYMLKRMASAYTAGRSDDLLKVKLRHDADALVVKHHAGQGRLAGLMGSITVETPAGLRFRIGSGFSDAQRAAPPPIGAVVTYSYSGFTRRGKPRFPVFLRIRDDEPKALP